MSVKRVAGSRWEPWEAARELVAAAPDLAEGWTDALVGVAEASGADWALLQAHQGADSWVAAASRPPASPPAEGCTAVRVGCGEGLELELRLGLDVAALPPLGTRLADLAPTLLQAVRTQLSMEAGAIRLAMQMMRRSGLQPIICAPDGAVLHGPEPELLQGAPLRVAAGRLLAACPKEDVRLRAALRAAGERGREDVLVLGRETATPAVADILPPLTGAAPRFRRHAMVLLRGRTADARARAPILQQLYGLTSAEAHVALAVTDGAPVSDIAARRGVAASTVRAQVKAILSKVGVGRQLELVQRVTSVC